MLEAKNVNQTMHIDTQKSYTKKLAVLCYNLEKSGSKNVNQRMYRHKKISHAIAVNKLMLGKSIQCDRVS